MPEHNGSFSDENEPPREDDRFLALKEGADPALRLIAWLIANQDFRQLEQRTGISVSPPVQSKPGNFIVVLLRRFLAWLRGTRQAEAGHFLPVLLQLDVARVKPELFSEPISQRYGIPLAYQVERKRNRDLTHVTGHLPLGSEISRGSVDSLVDAVRELNEFGVGRVCLGVPGQPSRQRELRDIGLPDDREYNAKVLNGQGVIVGIIDDGCALANRDFLKKTLPGAAVQSRILRLWDQGGADMSGGWQALADFPYGRELTRAQIETALNANRNGDLVREDAVYQRLGYRIGEVATHGTHVMDIAAGTGQTLMGIEGVAPGADIIFVQLPPPSIEGGATALWKHIKDGAAYIFDRAGNMPAVVNISYGGYDGPHDGSSALEKALDELLAAPNRAIVIAAGNGFEADCHAATEVPQNGKKTLRWIVKPVDPTANDMELWYDATSTLSVRLRPPSGAIDPAGWVQLGQAETPIRRGGKVIGYIEHLKSDTGNGGVRILISLNATERAVTTETTEMSPVTEPAPAGMWHVDLKHVSGPKAEVHAWIWRDDAGSSRNARLRQSRFHPRDADPTHTIAGWATGHRTISVGAYNSATNEICRYSAAGPTRPVGGERREKPEIYAPGEEDVRGYGVLSASALSARPTRMNGTSAAAPHVTGLIALIFDYAKNHANPAVSLTADQISAEVKAQARTNDLELNRHQEVDDWVLIKQSAVLAHLVPTGKSDFSATITQLL